MSNRYFGNKSSNNGSGGSGSGGGRSAQSKVISNMLKKPPPGSSHATPRDADGHTDASPVASHSPPAYFYPSPSSNTQQASPEISLPVVHQVLSPSIIMDDLAQIPDQQAAAAAQAAADQMPPLLLGGPPPSSLSTAATAAATATAIAAATVQERLRAPAVSAVSEIHVTEMPSPPREPPTSFLPRIFKARPNQPHEYHPMYANPRRIYLVRHGEAWGNVDESVFERIPDSQVPITPKGYQQARKAGELLRGLIGAESVEVFCSPYTRALQTADAIVESLRQVCIQHDDALYSMRVCVCVCVSVLMYRRRCMVTPFARITCLHISLIYFRLPAPSRTVTSHHVTSRPVTSHHVITHHVTSLR